MTWATPHRDRLPVYWRVVSGSSLHLRPKFDSALMNKDCAPCTSVARSAAKQQIKTTKIKHNTRDPFLKIYKFIRRPRRRGKEKMKPTNSTA